MHAAAILLACLAASTVFAGCSGGAKEKVYWNAFAFDQTVKPASGEGGKLVSFKFTIETSAAAERLKATGEGAYRGVEDIVVRAEKRDWGDLNPLGSGDPEIVSNLVEVRKVSHTLTVTGGTYDEAPPGTTGGTDVYLPLDLGEELTPLAASFAAKVYAEANDHNATFEYYLNAAMALEVQQKRALYLPYLEGLDGPAAWAMTVGLFVYAGGLLATFATGEHPLEVGSQDVDGQTVTVTKETFKIGGREFNGYRIAIEYDIETPIDDDRDGGSEGTLYAIVAPDLALPYKFVVEASVGTGLAAVGADVEFELTDIDLA